MREKTLVAAFSVFAAIFLTALKIAVGALTGSLGVLSEAADSALDIVAAGIALFAVRVADRPPDSNHPYGHAKVENLSALIAIGLLMLTCIGIINEAIQRILFKSVEIDAHAWAFGALFITMAIDWALSRALLRAARKHESQALEASALRFSGDIWNSCITLTGLTLVRLGQGLNLPWLERGDAIAALVLAVAMIVAGLRLGKRASDVLLDTAPRDLADDIRRRALQVEGVLDASKVRVRRVGAQFFVDMSIAVGRASTFEASHRIASAVEQIVRNQMPRADVLVHVDPVAPQGENLMDTLRGLAAKHELQVHSVRVQSIQNRLAIQFHVEVDDSLTLEEAHALVSHLEDEVARLIPNTAEVTSHIEPAQHHGTHDQIPGETLDAARRDVERIAREECGANGFHHINVRSVDGELGIVLHVFYDDRSSIREAHDLSTRLETKLRRQIPNVGQVLVHVEPRSMAV